MSKNKTKAAPAASEHALATVDLSTITYATRNTETSLQWAERARQLVALGEGQGLLMAIPDGTENVDAFRSSIYPPLNRALKAVNAPFRASARVSADRKHLIIARYTGPARGRKPGASSNPAKGKGK